MEEFDFEEGTELAERAEPQLLMPIEYSRRLGELRGECAVILRFAESVTATEILSVEDRDRVIEAGRLLQAVTKNVAEYFKPIKQKIDLLKQPFLDAERREMEMLKVAKERCGAAVQEFEQRQKLAEQILLEQNQALAARMAVEGELALPAIVQTAVPAKTRGKVERATWRAEVMDFPALIRAVAARQVVTMALLPNESYLNKRADSDREGMNIPGVEARKVEKVHFRM